MEFLGSPRRSGAVPADGPLYRALAAGDHPGAWMLSRPLLEPGQLERLSAPTAFNCALCLFQAGEYERALGPLRRAEQVLGDPAELDAADRKVLSGQADRFLQPMDPEWGGPERYLMIRARCLAALCLLRLERRQEAEAVLRFLARYHIEL